MVKAEPDTAGPVLSDADMQKLLGDICSAGTGMFRALWGSPAGLLRFPDTNVSLDIKDARLSEIADALTKQTGIQFLVSEGVPKDLRITLHVGGMPVKQFLDTLSSVTGIAYIAECRPAPCEPEPEGAEKPTATTFVVPQPGEVRRVTHVTFTTLGAEGVIVNLGKVSIRAKNADPIELVTNLIKQINGAGYVVMSLDDYLDVQGPARAEEVKKGIKKVPRAKVTLELRDADLKTALQRLAEEGKFYIAAPLGGVPNFLIIPDVEVANIEAMPGLETLSDVGGFRPGIVLPGQPYSDSPLLPYTPSL